MELGRAAVAPAVGYGFPRPPAGPGLLPFSSARRPRHSSSLRSWAIARAAEKPQTPAEDRKAMQTLKALWRKAEAFPETPTQKALLAVFLSLGFALGSAEAAVGAGPEGPLVEEFWENMRRYGLYFLTVFTGGLYSLLQPIVSLLRNPWTAVFTVAFLTGSVYLLYLTLNAMLGITAFRYDFAS